MELEHENGRDYRPAKVSVQHDGRVHNFDVNPDGTVEVETEVQAQALEETSQWKRTEDTTAPYALRDKTIEEVEEYLEDIDDLERLKELRQLESEGKARKNALQSIDNRLKEVKNQDEISGENEGEDGTETEE